MTSTSKHHIALPLGWHLVETSEDGYAYDCHMGLRVILTVSKELDKKEWIHLSVSRADRLPDWDDLKYVKGLFIGDDKTALMVFPPKSKFVNIHPYCHHLWSCIDGDVTPDFTRGGNTI